MPRERRVEERGGVELTNLDQSLGAATPDGAEPITKRQLVDYLDAFADRILPNLADRALSVIRVRPGSEPFMQKNLPAYAPDWIDRVAIASAASHRTVHYPVCGDRRTLLWLANQRAVEYHPAVTDIHGRQNQLIIDLDPPEGEDFSAVVAAAHAVRAALDVSHLEAAVKTSGSKGIHIVVPVGIGATVEDVAAATRALAHRTAQIDPKRTTVAYVKDEREGKVFVDTTRAGGATLAAAYSPRLRPGMPISFPLRWNDIDTFVPGSATIATATDLLGDSDPWRETMPAPQALPADLIAQGHTIPIARVVAMHAAKRRRRMERPAD